MEPILIIMAAGMGSRYGGNKQIDPVTAEGDIIMDFSLYDAYQAGFRRVVYVIKEDFEEVFKAHMESRADSRMEAVRVFQQIDDIPAELTVPEGRVKPWGTAHALYAARDVVDAPFAVINADDYYGREAFQLIYDYLKNEADDTNYCMVGFNIENTLSENGTVSRGVCREEAGKLTYIEEHYKVGRQADGAISAETGEGEIRTLDEGTPVSMNLWGFGKHFMDVLREKVPAIIKEIIDEGQEKGEAMLPVCVFDEVEAGNATVEVLRSSGQWFGVTYKEDKPQVVERLKGMKESGYYPQDLWK